MKNDFRDSMRFSLVAISLLMAHVVGATNLTLPLVRLSAPVIISDHKSPGEFALLALPPFASVGPLAMAIRIRGSFSQSFEKKSYSLKITGDEDRILKIPLLDLRRDRHWILDASFIDKSLIRNRVSHDLFLKLRDSAHDGVGQATERGRPVEVELNGDYRGAYILSERIDSKLLELDSRAIGSVLYKAVGHDANFSSDTWEGPGNPKPHFTDGYRVKYPESGEVASLEEIVSFVAKSDPATFESQVGARFDLDNLVDYWILVMVASGYDNIDKNYFLARSGQDGKFFLVPWDLDGTWGITWDGSSVPDVSWWPVKSNHLFERLLASPGTGFPGKLRARWLAMRKSALSADALVRDFSALKNILQDSGAYARNFSRWQQWDNAKTVDEVIGWDYLQDWIRRRVAFLDEQIASLPEK